MKINRKDIIKFILLLVFLASIIICSFVFYPKIKEKIDFENIRELASKNKIAWAFLFVILQIIQVVIFAIPGDIINATGGFVFNIFFGSLLSFIGVCIGSIITFYISRSLGYSFINKFIKKEKINKIVNFMSSNTGFLSMFVFCNLPFVPKDILMYAAGLTPLKPQRILLVYCLSRIPGIIIWNSMGANIYNKSILGIIITLCILAIFLLTIAIIKKLVFSNKIIKVNRSDTK
ncbi:MAG: VTT domain-containing protein [Candidatus Caccosoma sp.]|nr:VTT domain-containing protein [Candidatus Caccosoma sp.]